jgi:hypothetical protein
LDRSDVFAEISEILLLKELVRDNLSGSQMSEDISGLFNIGSFKVGWLVVKILDKIKAARCEFTK